MTDAGFFRGTSSEQDNRFSDKEKKLLKQMKFADNLTTKVEMHKIKLDVLKPWITKRISELLGMEDDVVVEFVVNQLEAEKHPDARKIQINLTGFLNGKNARIFTGELWGMLISAQESSVGIPASMVEAKKEEIKKRNEEQDRINETLKRTVGRFNDRLKQERESPPPSNRRDRSPDASARDRAPRSRSKDRDSKASRLSSKPGESADGKRSSPDPNSKNQEDSANQGKRNYRGRKSSSGSPEPNNKRKSRSRSSSREKRPDKRQQRDLMEEIKERRGGPDRDRGSGNFRDRPRRSRSPLQRQNKRSKSRSPLRGRSRRSPSPQRGFGRRRPSPYESRFRPDHPHRNPPPRRDSSADRHRKRDARRSRSRSPPTKESRSEIDKKLPTRLLPESVLNSAPSNNKTTKRAASPAPPASQPAKKTSKSGSSSDNESSSSSDRETEKPEKSSSKKKASASDDSSNSEEDQPSKKRKDKKKKKDKKHKKHKKHKKIKKSKKHSSSEDEDEESPAEVAGNGKLDPSKIAKSFLKLVEPHKDKTPSSEDLERKLREKALMSMKKASTSNR